MLTTPAIEQFIRDFRGDLIQSHDQEYDRARKVWNGLIDKRPRLIAQCADEGDVVRAVNFAREHDLACRGARRRAQRGRIQHLRRRDRD